MLIVITVLFIFTELWKRKIKSVSIKATCGIISLKKVTYQLAANYVLKHAGNTTNLIHHLRRIHPTHNPSRPLSGKKAIEDSDTDVDNPDYVIEPENSLHTSSSKTSTLKYNAKQKISLIFK